MVKKKWPKRKVWIYKIVSKEQLRRLRQRHSLAKIALKYNTTTVAIQRLCKKYGIRNPRKRTPLERDKLRVERVKRLLKFHAPPMVAKIIGITETSVYRIMRKEGLNDQKREKDV